MAETGCLRNASYHHVSVQGNLNATDSNPKNLKGETSGVTYNLNANDCGTITLGEFGQVRGTSSGGFTINLPKIRKGLYYKFILIHTSMDNNTDITINAFDTYGDNVYLIVGSVTKLAGGNDANNYSGRKVYGSNLKGKKIIFKGADADPSGPQGCDFGDSCELFCDGEYWFMKGKCMGDDVNIPNAPLQLVTS